MMLRSLLLCLAAVAATACGGHPSVQSVIAAHHHDRTIAAPAERALQPWRVGQWTLHKLIVNGKVAVVEERIVAQDACGIWLEIVEQSAARRTVMKTCFRREPDPTIDDEAQQLDLIQAAMSRSGERTIVVDFRNGQNPNTKRVMMAMLRASSTVLWQSEPSDEVATVTVPAGRFEGAAKRISRISIMESLHTIETWLHPSVPIGGAIKTRSTAGVETELLDYGTTGANTELPSFDEALRNSAFGE